MRKSDGRIIFDSKHEHDLYNDLYAFICKEYKGKRNMKRLANNIAWYMNERENDFFKGFIFDCQGTLSCWGIFEGGKDEEKDALYAEFMQKYCDPLMNDKDKKDSIVSHALCSAYNTIVREMKAAQLVY